jgi:phage baseplate assembly protein W
MDMELDREQLRRRALGWAAACPRIDEIDHGRDLLLEDGPSGRDLARVEGIDCLGQSLTVALTTLRGSDVFNTDFGFDGLNALVEETNPVITRERVRVGVINVLRREPRVRRIGDVRFGTGALGSADVLLNAEEEPIEPFGTVSVRVAFETVTGEPVTVDLGRVAGRD